MRLMRVLVGAFLAAALVPVAAAAQGERKPAELTGKWQFSVQTDAGSGTPTVTFTQKGDSVSGHYSSQGLGERDFTGTFKDGKLKFSFTSEVQGQAFTVTFSGAMDGDNAMKGSVDLGGAASGTFTGKRL